MGIDVTAKEKAELKRRGSLVRVDYETQEFDTWYNPKTGQEFPRLPSDSFSIRKYMRKGWIVGKAPENLRKKWEADRVKRTKLSLKRVEEAKRSSAYKEVIENKEKYGEDKFQDSVKQEVQRQLAEALGTKPVVEETTETEQDSQDSRQLEMKLF